jgi:CBS-domain-containing membrane protein
MSAAFEAVARSVAQYTAANIFSNIAAVIANYPMSPEAKNQIIAALVMALPNFDDSEALKSPVGKGLVRTREDFLHAAVSARFRHRTTPDEYYGYNNAKTWDAT